MTELAARALPRFGWLLALLSVSVVVQSLGAEPGPEGPVFDAFGTLLAIAIFAVVFRDSPLRLAGALALAAVLLTGWSRYVVAPEWMRALELVNQAIFASFLWAAVWTILSGIMRARLIGAEAVRGAICGYLIAGAGWASLNVVVYLVNPAAFAVDPSVQPLLVNWHGRVALISMYSYAQMLTIGYGAITPVRAPATTLSLFAALFGVFYMAVVVAQFVGMAPRRDGGS